MDRLKVAVGLSGGVDSAVAALLLRDQGYQVVGVHLYCWPPESEVIRQKDEGLSEEERDKIRREWVKKNGCRADEDEQMALKTALELGIKFVKLDFSEEYNRRVVDYFYAEYQAGRTPNPDVLCNSEIKFGLFLDWAMENGFDYVATGHYAKLKIENGKLKMMIPRDKHKDQTYFLWKLTQKELKRVLFPLSDLLKSEVRKIAMKNNLAVAQRKDSQGICFVGNIPAREFLSRRLKEKKGEVKNLAGEVIGSHDGVWFYTIGQRGGWKTDPDFQRKIVAKSKVKSLKAKVGMPVMYVVSKDAKKNELVVGVGEETKRQEFEVEEVNWINGQVKILNFQFSIFNCLVRIRHGGKLIKAKVSRIKDKVMVELEESQRGIAPGQSAVFYSKSGELLGGGVI